MKRLDQMMPELGDNEEMSDDARTRDLMPKMPHMQARMQWKKCEEAADDARGSSERCTQRYNKRKEDARPDVRETKRELERKKTNLERKVSHISYCALMHVLYEYEHTSCATQEIM